jgi:hypothetical protein
MVETSPTFASIPQLQKEHEGELALKRTPKVKSRARRMGRYIPVLYILQAPDFGSSL